MDEILASIRRIIETGEDRAGTTSRQDDSAAEAPPARAASGLPRLPERFDTRDLPPGHRASNPVLAAAASDVSSRITASMPEATSISEASQAPAELDDDARLTANLEEELAATWDQPAAEQPPQPEPEPEIAAALPQSPSPTEGSQPMSDMPSYERRPEFHPAPVAEPHAEQPVSNAERGSFSPANSDRPLPLSDERYEPVTLPLTSEATGTLVAASFSDLAQAIRSGELRSIEAMAQEMLRPMLQEWLDDNLPRMVERLVREEIERMSRGGRR
ncbi:PopZ family protein [Aureimonas sp. AU4]|uniref:PopZ family protein n=1 Tax=Aureimonas sp. AU4 TaxID=1638163 RepID=UPI000782D7B0|nr:DUF2497 domain-containing protein [Aureimonas sp. AU4]